MLFIKVEGKEKQQEFWKFLHLLGFPLFESYGNSHLFPYRQIDERGDQGGNTIEEDFYEDIPLQVYEWGNLKGNTYVS